MNKPVFIYIYFNRIRLPNKQKANKKQLDETFTFSFYKNKMIVKGKNSENELRYYKFRNIYETDTNYYFYINKEYSLILNKDGFLNDSKDDFNKFIKKKFLLRYKKVNIQ